MQALNVQASVAHLLYMYGLAPKSKPLPIYPKMC